MAIYELTQNELRQIDETTFEEVNVKERDDLQRLLRDKIEVIAPDTLVISEEFSEWRDAKRRIDLLAIDREGNLVVIELKRTETGGHMELQAIRYAAMVSTMTLERAVDVYGRYLKSRKIEEDPERKIREFLESDESDEGIEERFARDVRIVLAAAEFSKELTTTVMWLNERSMDIRCVRLRPYLDGKRVFLDVQQIVPLPEAEQYQVKLREKAQRQRDSRNSSMETKKFDVILDGEVHPRLTKRQAVLTVVKHLHRKGVAPQAIMDKITFKKFSAFKEVAGEIRDESVFVERALCEAKESGRRFDSDRYFTSSDELFHADGKTYCVSNQWGVRTEEWLMQVINAFPERGIILSVSSEAQDAT